MWAHSQEMGTPGRHVTPQQHLQNHSSGHLEGWGTLWLAAEKLDGRCQRVDVPIHSRTAHSGFLQKKTGRGYLPNYLSCPASDQISQVTELN